MNTQRILDDLKTTCVMLGYKVENYHNCSKSGFAFWRKKHENKGLIVTTPRGILKFNFYFIDGVFQVFKGTEVANHEYTINILQVYEPIAIIPYVTSFLTLYGKEHK